MKKKPIFTILIIFIAIIITYFAFWKITTKKIESSFKETIKKLDINFKDVNVSGFPFSKNIIISDLEFKNNNNYINQDVLKIKKVIMSSLIFGNNYKISLKEIGHYDSLKKQENIVKFNSEPNINISFYKNKKLQSFSYEDTGYKILNPQNQEIYSFGPSNLKIYSTLLENALDYSIKANFSEIKNFNALNNKKELNKLKMSLIPDSYDLQTDLSLYFKTENENIKEGSIKINNISLKNNIKNIQVSLNGNLKMDEEDTMMSGNLKIQIDNFEKFSSTLLDNYIVTQKENFEKDPIGTSVQIKNFSNKIANFKKLAQKNKETTNKKAVFLIEREKNKTDYLINNESLLAFLDAQNKQAQQEIEKEKLRQQKIKMEKEQQLLEEKKTEIQNKTEENSKIEENSKTKETSKVTTKKIEKKEEQK